MTGPYWWSYWALILDNVVDPAVPLVQAGARPTSSLLLMLSIVVNVGMWLERFVIIVTCLHRDFLPSSWGMYYADDLGLDDVLGTIGLFLTLFFLFVRFLPMISIFEMRTLVPEAKVQKDRD